MFKTIALRALRGFIAGAIGSAIALVPIDFVDYRGLKLWLVKSSFVVLIGGITGAYMAFDKFRRWQEPPIEIRVTPEDIQ